MVTSRSSMGTGRKPLLLAAMLFFFVLLSLIGPSSAHMVMSEPPPINYVTNPNYIASKGDFDYSAPITPTGSNYPCRGHLKDLNTPQGQPIRTYKQGSTYKLVISGSAPHGGGSCQAALSYDKGTTWVVIKSWIGNCPHPTPGGDQTFQFPIPTNAPSGVAVFAWTWFNNVGNREMYMNCAVVTIGSGSSRLKERASYTGPSLFLANIGNGCTTAPNTDVVFPNPGTVVEYGGNSGSRAPPVGNCANQVLTGGGATTGGGGSTGGGTSGGTSGGSTSGDTSGGGSGNNGMYNGGGTSASSSNNGMYNGGSGTSTKSVPTGTNNGQGKTTAASTFSYVYSTSLDSAPSFTPLYPSSLHSPTSAPVAGNGVESGKLYYPTATNGIARPGAATNTAGALAADGANMGCDYWRTQGYVCSAAAPSLLGKWTISYISFGFLAFAWIYGGF